eukprot:232255_1
MSSNSPRFSSGLFDCSDSSYCDCYYACCCAPCFIGSLMGKKDGNGCCCTCLGIMFCGVVCTTLIRKSVRDTYRIEGGMGSDFCAMCCAQCCAALQMKREVDARTKMPMNN